MDKTLSSSPSLPPPSLMNKMTAILTNKPFKKAYRLGLLMLLLVILNNTSTMHNTNNNNYDTITGMITGAIKNNICGSDFSSNNDTDLTL